MSGSLVAVISLFLFFLAYRFYSKFLAEKVYRLNPDAMTPSHQFHDGLDYVPANKYILWGHHFTSIAGAAPIVGPAIAIYWGWLPAILWVVLGTIFAAGVHDFINSWQLLLGLAILYAGLFVINPDITAPSANPDTPDASWFPLLFITIACGAISGFHGLVSSGTTAKQLNKETDARFVGYLGAIGEGSLALITILAIATFFGSGAEFTGQYASFDDAGSVGLTVFVEAAAHLATGLYIPLEAAQTIIAVIVISFAATTLDTSVRLMRYIINELGQEYKVRPLTHLHVSTFIAVGASAALVLIPEGPRGLGSGGYLLWPLFGTSNQLLAGISLLLVTIWLKRSGRSIIYTLVPMIFLSFVTIWAMVEHVFFEWSGAGEGDANLLLFFFGAVILVFAVWIILEAVRLLRRTD